MRTYRSMVDFAFVAGPKVLGGSCLVLLNIGLMGWLGRESFGIYSLCLAGISLLSEGVLGAAMDLGVLRFAPLYGDTDPGRAFSIERAALLLKVQVVGLPAIVLILASGLLSRLVFHRDGMAFLIWIVCAAALGMLLLSSALVHLQVRGRFVLYGAFESLHMLVKFGGIGVVLYALKAASQPVGPGHVLIWFAAGPLAAFLVFLATIGRRFLLPAAAGYRSRAELLGYVTWYLLTFAVTAVVARIDVFMLTSLSTIDEVGLFAGGQTIANIPVLFGTYLAVIMSPKVMPYYRDGRFYGLLRNVQLSLFVVCTAAYALVLWNREFIVTHLLPESFAASAGVILILLPATLAGMTSFPLAVTFLLFVHPRFLIRLECLVLPWLVIAYLVLISRYGAVGAAAVTAGFGLIKTAIAQYFAFRWARLSPRQLGLAPDVR